MRGIHPVVSDDYVKPDATLSVIAKSPHLWQAARDTQNPMDILISREYYVDFYINFFTNGILRISSIYTSYVV